MVVITVIILITVVITIVMSAQTKSSVAEYVSAIRGRRLLKISRGAQDCFTNSPGRQPQRILNAADDKE
jgi:hypothetical protein